MRHTYLTCTVICAVCIGMLGCASYKPQSLSLLQKEFAPFSETKGEVTLSAKVFTKADCRAYFDRDLIRKGYQPIQVTIFNDSKRYLLFTPDGVTLPLVDPSEVARKAHTSTAGRATAYGIGGLIIWPLLIPAVVDGVGSSNANQAADADFAAKGVNQTVIQPYSNHNGVIFVSTKDYQPAFTIRVVDKETLDKFEFDVRL